MTRLAGALLDEERSSLTFNEVNRIAFGQVEASIRASAIALVPASGVYSPTINIPTEDLQRAYVKLQASLATMRSNYVITAGQVAATFDFTIDIFSVDAFLAVLYRFARSGQISPGIQHIFKSLNKLLQYGQFNTCDEVFDAVDVNMLQTDHLLSFLTISRAGRATLKNRCAYRNRAWQRIAAIHGRPMATRLLGTEIAKA
ncbi:MAG TPA: hypothetical protein VGG64_04925 [Pirellulales bacterium]|jgi:hypothetical protein